MNSNSVARPSPLDAVRLARDTWLSEQRIDMRALAAELGISRATLYNWFGDRERLTGELLWSIAEPTIMQARDQAHGTGPEWIVQVIERYLKAFAAFDPARRFIERDPEFALRVLTGSRTQFQQRLIDKVADLIEEQIESAGYEPPLEPGTLAYLLVRIGESFIFNDLITGTEPDLDKAVEASSVLQHASPVVGSRRGAGGARQARLPGLRPGASGARSGAL
jgi:AcrR family transcriptional regulator